MTGIKERRTVHAVCTKDDHAKLKLLADGAGLKMHQCVHRIITGENVSTAGQTRILKKMLAILSVITAHEKHYTCLRDTVTDEVKISMVNECLSAAQKAASELTKIAAPAAVLYGSKLGYDERRS